MNHGGLWMLGMVRIMKRQRLFLEDFFCLADFYRVQLLKCFSGHTPFYRKHTPEVRNGLWIYSHVLQNSNVYVHLIT